MCRECVNLCIEHLPSGGLIAVLTFVTVHHVRMSIPLTTFTHYDLTGLYSYLCLSTALYTAFIGIHRVVLLVLLYIRNDSYSGLRGQAYMVAGVPPPNPSLDARTCYGTLTRVVPSKQALRMTNARKFLNVP